MKAKCSKCKVNKAYREVGKAGCTLCTKCNTEYKRQASISGVKPKQLMDAEVSSRWLKINLRASNGQSL